MARSRGGIRAALIAGALACAAPALAQVDCATLVADYCFGDECYLPTLEVASPCVVDFGVAVVQINGTLRVPAGGVLSFTAGRISSNAPIRGGDGAVITLEATGPPNPAVSINKPISVYGGRITLRGGFVGAFVPIKVKTRPGGVPGSLTVEADDLIQFTKPLRVNGRRASADGGNVILHANGEIRIQDIDVSGLQGGSVSITSDADGIVCFSDGCRVRARGGVAGAGGIHFTGSSVFLQFVKLQADGGGGDIRLRALGNYAQVVGSNVDVRGGVFEAEAALSLRVQGTFRAAPGGCIGLNAPMIDTTGAVFDTTPVADCPD